MAQEVQCLPCKHEDVGLISGVLIKQATVVAQACNSSIWEAVVGQGILLHRVSGQQETLVKTTATATTTRKKERERERERERKKGRKKKKKRKPPPPTNKPNGRTYWQEPVPPCEEG